MREDEWALFTWMTIIGQSRTALQSYGHDVVETDTLTECYYRMIYPHGDPRECSDS